MKVGNREEVIFPNGNGKSVQASSGARDRSGEQGATGTTDRGLGNECPQYFPEPKPSKRFPLQALPPALTGSGNSC